jgi:hypothetical protein
MGHPTAEEGPSTAFGGEKGKRDRIGLPVVGGGKKHAQSMYTSDWYLDNTNCLPAPSESYFALA